MNQLTQHKSVLLSESIEYLNISPNNWYLDATLGGGGHTLEIIKNGGKVIGIDRDAQAIDRTKNLFKDLSIPNDKYRLVQSSFAEVKSVVESFPSIKISGIIFDLGISTDQLDNQSRGFSLLKEGPLDMRMDMSNVLTAEQIINHFSPKDLVEMFQVWGDVRKAQLIVSKIVERRSQKYFTNTTELADFIKQITPQTTKTHPATQIFQALRIVVNNEPEQLVHGLFYGWEILDKDGRLVVISFHSGEDRVVKRFMLDHKSTGQILTPKPIVPNRQEIADNIRSRSAKLRAIKKI